MNHLRSIVGVAVVTSAIAVSAPASAALAAGASAAEQTGSNPSVCYEAENHFGEWLDRDHGCNGQLVAPSGGIYGLAITVKGVRQVLYSVHDGAAFNSGSDGQQVNSGNPATALRALLSPRMNKHLEYTVTYDDAGAGAEQAQTARDNAVAGDTVNALTSVRIRITS